jgi:hypothetical protein
VHAASRGDSRGIAKDQGIAEVVFLSGKGEKRNARFGRCKYLAGALVEQVQRKKSTLVLEVRTATVQHVEVTEDSLVVDLADGRTTSVPLAWYPRLLHAVPEERGN